MIEQQTSRERFILNAGSPEENQAKLAGVLAEFGVDYDPNISLEQNNSTFRLLQKFNQYGVIEKQSGHLVWDAEKVKNFPYGHSNISANRKTVTLADIRAILDGLTGYSKADVDAAKGDFSKLEKRRLLVLPKDIKSIASAEKEGWPQASSEALIHPWELGKQNYDWVAPIELASGEEVNLAELAVAYKLQHDLHAQKNNKGQLEISPDPGKAPYKKFSARLFNKLVNINPVSRGASRMVSFESSPVEFTHDYLPNLVKLGFFNEQKDFRRIAGRVTEDRFRPHPRRLNPKVPYLHFSNSKHPFAKYYIGREKIVGLNIPVDSETMEAQMLDQDTAGILQKDAEGRRKILCIFSLFFKEDLDPRYKKEEERLTAKYGSASPTKVTQGISISGSEMEKRIRAYDTTEFLPPRPDEKPADYFRRIRPLDDVEFVLQKVHGFFVDSGIGVQNLPWAEQLVLSRALLENRDSQRLVNFAKTQGLAGVRSFLSLDYDKKMGNRILDIGDKLDATLSKEVFKKYGEIVDTAAQAQYYLENHLPERSTDSDDIAKVREQLLKKGKDLLIQMSMPEKGRGQLETVELLEQLVAVKTDILLFAATFKSFVGEEKLNLSEYQGVILEEKDSGDLSAQEKEEMLEIFQANRLGNYPDKLREFVTRDFNNILSKSGHKFRVLRHDGRVVAFFHYDHDQKDSKAYYVGSLNLHPSAKDSPIAVTMLKDALKEKADKNITAVVWANNPARLFYTKFLGFKKVGEIADYHGTGEVYWELERKKQDANIKEMPKAA